MHFIPNVGMCIPNDAGSHPVTKSGSCMFIYNREGGREIDRICKERGILINRGSGQKTLLLCHLNAVN